MRDWGHVCGGVIFQCLEVMKSGPQSSPLGSFRIPFGAKNVSQIEDLSYVAPISGGSSSDETSPRGETYLTTDSSPQNGEGKGKYTHNQLSDTSGKALSNGTLEVDRKFPTAGKKNSTMEPVSEQSSPPSPVEEVSGTPPAYSPSDAKTNTSLNGNGSSASSPLPPAVEPSVAPPIETTKKNNSAKEPAEIQIPTKNEDTKALPKVVLISQMDDLLCQTQHSYRSMKPVWPSVDKDILSAKS